MSLPHGSQARCHLRAAVPAVGGHLQQLRRRAEGRRLPGRREVRGAEPGHRRHRAEVGRAGARPAQLGHGARLRACSRASPPVCWSRHHADLHASRPAGSLLLAGLARRSASRSASGSPRPAYAMTRASATSPRSPRPWRPSTRCSASTRSPPRPARCSRTCPAPAPARSSKAAELARGLNRGSFVAIGGTERRASASIAPAACRAIAALRRLSVELRQLIDCLQPPVALEVDVEGDHDHGDQHEDHEVAVLPVCSSGMLSKFIP